MKYELIVRRQAKTDVRRGAEWYERQRRGLGREFVAEVDAALEKIKRNPEHYQIVHRDIRHAIARRFPYGVFYRIEHNNIIIFAVIHLHRNEIIWKSRT